MSALKDLRPFVRLCQIVGLIPYSLEIDPETKSFRRFRFSIKSLPAWWYIIALVAQAVGFIVIGVSFSDYYQSNHFSDLQLPIVVTLLGASSHFIFIIVQIFKRGIILRYYTLGRVVELLKGVERNLKDLPGCKNSVFKRTIAGLLLSTTLAGLSILAGLSSKVVSYLAEDSVLIDPFTFVYFAIIQNWVSIFVWCTFIFMHLSYYIPAFYIRLLRIKLSKNLPFTTTQDTEGELVRVKKSQLIFNDICRAIIELNRVYSFPALFIITAKLVSFLNGLFTIIYQLIKPEAYAMLNGGLWVTVVVTLTDFSMILVYIISADMPIHQVRLLRETVIWISNREMQSNVDYRIEVMSFMMMMDEDRIRLTGTRLFKVGIHLIPPLTASLITYLIILLQTQINSSNDSTI